MADPQSFYGGLRGGAPAPPVKPEDLKRVWQFIRTMQKVASRLGSAEAAGASGQPAFSIQSNLVPEHCSPGANASAVFFRCSMLGVLLKQGLLAPWQRGEEVDEFLFAVFATYPLHVGKFDIEALMQHIREKAKS